MVIVVVIWGLVLVDLDFVILLLLLFLLEEVFLGVRLVVVLVILGMLEVKGIVLLEVVLVLLKVGVVVEGLGVVLVLLGFSILWIVLVVLYYKCRIRNLFINNVNNIIGDKNIGNDDFGIVDVYVFIVDSNVNIVIFDSF